MGIIPTHENYARDYFPRQVFLMEINKLVVLFNLIF